MTESGGFLYLLDKQYILKKLTGERKFVLIRKETKLGLGIH